VPEDLLIAQAEQESNFDPSAVSKAGAQGISQFMPATAKDMGLADPFDPAQSIEAQGKYMRQLLDRYQGDETKALAAYNAGMGNVDKAGGVPDFPETQDYIKRIAERRKKYVGADVSAALSEAIPTGGAQPTTAEPGAAPPQWQPIGSFLGPDQFNRPAYQGPVPEYSGPVTSALKMGLYDIMSGGVGLLEMGRVPGADVAQSWVAKQIEGVMGKMSPEDQMNFQREFASLDEDSVWQNPSSLMYQMVRQLPQLLTFMIPVGVIAKAGTAAKGVKGIAAAKKARQIKAAKVGAGIEAAQGAGFASAEISQAIDSATEAEMYESPAYTELRETMGDAEARKQIKQDAQAVGGLLAGAGSAAVGFIGGKAFAKILTDKNSTITKAVRNGVITQAAEEAPQEMFEQAGANIGQAAQGIPVSPTAGLLEAGVAGGVMGGGVGGGVALAGRAVPTGTEAKEEGLVTERAAQTEAKKAERATQMAVREKTTAAGRAKADELGVDILNDMGETEPSGVGGKYSDIDVQFRYEEMQDEAKATAAEEAKVAEEAAKKEEVDTAAEEAGAQPAAYLLAQENDVDLADVKPSGGKYNDTITKADVRKVISQRAKEDKRVAKAEAKAAKEATKAAKVAPTVAAAEAGPETDPYKLARAEDYGSVEAKAALEATDHALADVRTEYGLGKGQLLTKKQVDKYVNARAEDRGMNPQLKSYFAEKNAEFAAADIPEMAIGDLTRNDANKVTKTSIDVDFENASPAAAAMTEFEGAAVVSADAMDESVPMATVGQGLSDFIDSTPHKTGKGTTPEKKNQWRLNQTQALADVAARVDRHLANTEERYEAGEIQGYKDDLLDGIIAWKEMDNEAVLKNAPGAETG
jgi:hypothetical protein